MGKAFLAGLVFAVLLIPINRWLAIKIGKLSTEMMEQKDARVQLMSEILHGIRVIKLSAWESIFTGKINTLRCVCVCVFVCACVCVCMSAHACVLCVCCVCASINILVTVDI